VRPHRNPLHFYQVGDIHARIAVHARRLATALPPPAELSKDEARYWVALVGQFPRERFDIDDVPLLVELCRHQNLARKINVELNAMRRTRLIGPSPERVKVRAMFNQLLRAAREETKLITNICVKLRLAQQTSERKIVAERERARMATGPRPWDTIAGQHRCGGPESETKAPRRDGTDARPRATNSNKTKRRELNRI
jgi:hypothetical protein